MNTEQLRDTIWEQLFQSKDSKSVHELAMLNGCDMGDILHAVSHEWFSIEKERIGIAYAKPVIARYR